MDKQEDIENSLIGMYKNDSNFLTFLQFFSSVVNTKTDLSGSIRHKINAIHFFGDEILQQINEALKERELFEKERFGSTYESTILQLRFETFLNAIYSLCDNISYVGQRLNPNLKFGFNTQFKRVNDYLDKYPDYEDYLYLIKKCEWYQQLHNMRTESTHYLPGFVYYPDSDKFGILYKDMIHSDDEINIKDLSSYVQEILQNVDDFLEKLGKYAIDKCLTDESKTVYICGIKHQNPKGESAFLIGIREVTYKEYKEKEVGTCINRDVPCPHKEFCPAYKF